MNELPQNELLSAYLDGELTADERARVEELLAADPGARRLVDEFRAVRGRLQALPKYTVGEDLGDRVLRAAERRMLGQSTAPAGAEETSLSPKMRTWRSVARRFLSPRALAWSAAAAAVALVLMFNDVGQQPAPRAKLARAPASSAESAHEAPSFRAAPDEMDLHKLGEGGATEEESAEKRVEPLDRRNAKSGAGEGIVAGKDGGAMKAEAPAVPTMAKSAPATPAPAAMKPAADGLAADQPTAAPAVEGKMAESQPKSAVVRGKAGVTGELGWQREERDRAARFATQFARSSLAQGEVLIVRCQVRADQTPHQPFQRILLSNQIDWEGPPSVPSKAKGEDGRQSFGVEPNDRAQEKARPAQPELAADKKAALTQDQLAETKPAAAKAGEPATATAGAVEGVLVEATWDQVEATVAELSKRSDVYASVALESLPGANVPRALDRYNRLGGKAANMPGPGSGENKPQQAPADVDAKAAKGANVANAQRRGIARALGPMPPSIMPATAPPAGLPELPLPLSYGGQQESQEVRQQAVPKASAPGGAGQAGRDLQQPQAPATPPAPGMGGMGVLQQRPAATSAQQQSAPESTALAAEPRTYRVLFLFETATPPAAANVQKADVPAKPQGR